MNRDMSFAGINIKLWSMLGKRESQTQQVFNFASLLFLKLFAGTKFCKNGQKLQRMTKFNTF